jgi:hypothetical protein
MILSFDVELCPNLALLHLQQQSVRLSRPNPYEAPGCQEAKYSHERNLGRFFVLAKPVSGGVG